MNGTYTQGFQVPAGLAIVGLGLLWGACFPAIDIVVSELPPLGAAGVRYGVSGCLVLGYAWVSKDRICPDTARELVSVGLVGVFMFGAYQAGLFLSTQYIPGAVAAVVTTMSPVVAALVAVPVLGESRGLPDVVGFCLGVSGVVVLSQPSLDPTSLSTTALGVALVFAGTVLFAVGSVTIQLFDEGLPVEALQGWAMLFGAALLFGGGAIRGESVPAVGSVSPLALLSLGYITLVGGAGGYLLYFRLVRRVGATETTLVAYLEPVAATFVSVLFLGQVVSTTTVVGFLAVATGFTLVSRDTMRRAVTKFRAAEAAHTEHNTRGD